MKMEKNQTQNGKEGFDQSKQDLHMDCSSGSRDGPAIISVLTPRWRPGGWRWSGVEMREVHSLRQQTFWCCRRAGRASRWFRSCRRLPWASAFSAITVMLNRPVHAIRIKTLLWKARRLSIHQAHESVAGTKIGPLNPSDTAGPNLSPGL
jgi:hypothetical protein